MKRRKQLLIFLLSFFTVLIVLFNPQVVTEGAVNGLIICANVIIPSLFPFSVVCMFIIKSNCLNVFGRVVSPLSLKLFGIPPSAFFAMLLSFLGGYPVGAKIIEALRKENKISSKCAAAMLYYCINAGPAFIIIAVGSNILNSKNAGIVLLVAHILSSVIIALIVGRLNKNKETNEPSKKENNKHISEVFVESTADSCTAVISICAYVVLFSTVIGLIKSFEFPLLTYGVCPMLEVTTGVMNTRNIYIIAALLGWGGLSVHCQIFSVCKSIKINKIHFFAARIFHAALSVGILYILLKFFPISIETLSNNIVFTNSFSALTVGASISLILSGIVLIASVGSRKY